MYKTIRLSTSSFKKALFFTWLTVFLLSTTFVAIENDDIETLDFGGQYLSEKDIIYAKIMSSNEFLNKSFIDTNGDSFQKTNPNQNNSVFVDLKCKVLSTGKIDTRSCFPDIEKNTLSKSSTLSQKITYYAETVKVILLVFLFVMVSGLYAYDWRGNKDRSEARKLRINQKSTPRGLKSPKKNDFLDKKSNETKKGTLNKMHNYVPIYWQ